MIINAFIRGQSLKLPRPKIVAGSNDYHEMQIILQTADWAGLDIWGHFSQDGKNIFDVHAVDCHVGKDQHLNLAAGEWKVYFSGMDPDGTERITTEQQILTVQATGCICGPFPAVPLSHAEQVTQEAAQARKLAEETRKIVVDNAPLTDRAEAAAQAAEAAKESAAGSMSSAALSAQQAGRDAGQAATSAQAANASDYSAAESAQKAGDSASTATAQATAAARSATQAQEAQEAAASSSAAAAGSEARVTADADRAGAEATRAAQDAERATRAAASAEDDAGFAKASQEAAAGSAGAASTSAGQAASSAKAAQQAATNAGASADQAQTDALAATGAAQSAKTEAGRAKSEADRSAAAAALSVAHGITGAKVGDLMQITQVDEKGVPTALKPTTLEDLEGKWELAETIKGADAVIDRLNKYDFKAIALKIETTSDANFNVDTYADSPGRNVYTSLQLDNGKKYGMITVEPKHGRLDLESYVTDNKYLPTTISTLGWRYHFSNQDEGAKMTGFKTRNVIPATVTVEVWGVKA